ncbi:hypothetical protein M441DRAFT_50971 [Trichoderma asperellum CBS 433.97]|uniref:Uncharacterized protein n=1 Tax=Trichoderma asperellum (strain ATCC 204424 / CBS 433.97 / NBRC 101777) TaxID=1042311 RepID=A0A2T3YWP0_TRIA4|nr:hypothetical protein M441DRAFT_50971 [Trichoderma asperellum CBS 433.97]PTB36966.1 hypothetical protein M441DRAFT_50971 [Trichoderma asperellum CBS 433.97]
MHAIALHLQLCACRAPLIGAATTAASSSAASALDPSPPWGVSAGQRQESGLEPGAGAGAGAGIWDGLGPSAAPIAAVSGSDSHATPWRRLFAAIETRQRCLVPTDHAVGYCSGQGAEARCRRTAIWYRYLGLVGDGGAAARVR